MSRYDNHIPKYCQHKASGQAFVTLEGRDIYLGKYGTAASRAEYDRVITEWITAGRRLPIDRNTVTVAEVVAAFRRHALSYYRDADGKVGKHVTNIDEAVRPLLKLYSNTPALEFGPLRLKAVRQGFIDAGRVRSNINRLVGRIRHVFKWAAENELIPAAVHYGLTAVGGLQAGRSSAAESDPVKPVPLELVEAVIPHVSPQIAAMIRLQLLTGMRPGEVTIMRGTDIDMSAKPWAYRPAHHKNQHRGHERVIYLGPRAEEVIRPFLKTDVKANLFSPAEAEAWRRARLHERRKTPLSCGNRPGSNSRRKPRRTPGVVYSTNAYLIAVYRGCDAAFPATPKITANPDDLKAWRRKHRWHVNQLRHMAATVLRKEHGLEVAQVILGHRRIETSQLYAEKNVEAAKRVMAAVG